MGEPDDAAGLGLAAIREQILGYEPRLEPAPAETHLRAAVALVLHEEAGADGPELLFIERAEREGDPWSGQMAFPGGRMDRDDPDLAATACRETAEEVAVELGEPIGRLDDLAGSRDPQVPPIVVSPYVYALSERPQTSPNHEVRSTVWVPVSWILHPDSALEYRFERPSFSGSFPAFGYQGYTVWGLTYRVLEMFFEVLGRELPSNEGRLAGEEQTK